MLIDPNYQCVHKIKEITKNNFMDMLVLFFDFRKVSRTFLASDRRGTASNYQNRVLQFFIFNLSSNVAFEVRWRLLEQSQPVVSMEQVWNT